MSCCSNAPISPIPPVSQGGGPLVWLNGNQVARLNTPLQNSLFFYDGSKAWWANGSASQPIVLNNLQEQPTNTPYLIGVNSSNQLVKTNASLNTTNNLTGGAPGYVPYQIDTGVTGFVPAGEASYLFASTGPSAPTWIDQGSITVGSSISAYSLTLVPWDTFNGGSLIWQDSTNTTQYTNVGNPNQVLIGNGINNAPSWVNQSTLSVGLATTATTATNIFDGAQGSLPYQTASSTTTTLPIGTANQILSVNSGATAPIWQTGIKGVTDGSSAPSGFVGEWVNFSLLSSGTLITPVTNTPIAIGSISLTAGDWSVNAIGQLNLTNCSLTNAKCGISTSATSFVLPSGSLDNYASILSTSPANNQSTSLGNTDDCLSCKTMRVSLTTTTTLYLVINAIFTGAGSLKVYGNIEARRVR